MQNPYIVVDEKSMKNLNEMNSEANLQAQKMNFIKGALIGVAVGYILTNKNAQEAILKGIAKLTQFIQVGAEELKEKFEDAKAELQENE